MPPDDHNDELTIDLRRLATKEAAPSTSLEDRVVTSLHQSKLLRSLSPAWRPFVFGLAAALLAFAIGWTIGRTIRPTLPDYTYVLFLQEGPSFHPAASATEETTRVTAVRGWATQLRQAGIPISGLKLEDSTVSVRDDETVPLSNHVAGLFTVEVSSAAAAEKLARSCPHLRYGGEIVVRPIANSGGR